MIKNSTLPAILLVVFLASTNVHAQTSKYNLSYRVLSYDYRNPQASGSDLNDVYDNLRVKGAEIGLHRRISDRFTLGVPFSIGVAELKRASNRPVGKGDFLSTLDLLATFYATKSSYWIRPYIQLGPSVMRNWTADDWAGHFPVGAGFAFKVADGVSFDLGSHYRTASNDINGWHHHAGFTLRLGQDDVTPPPPPPPSDRDGDGVADDVDKCPDVAGIPYLLMGCPDADGDGIADGDDKCPNEKGLANLMGCPDTDGDGIANAEDKCPTVKGFTAFMGCPDTDGDGIMDSEDKCPTEAGPKSNAGCPVKISDRDGDGIADADDVCPDLKGEARYKGCPDSDGDGVSDNSDKCPKEAGPASNSGCPVIKAEDKAKIDFAIKNVRFNTSSNVLTADSYAVLDEVVGVMGKYPGYSLSIAGHTDSDGDAAANQTLSERRAKACYDYLVSKGVTAARMNHAGYGETQPIADNKTQEGKKMNRRVDFNLFIK